MATPGGPSYASGSSNPPAINTITSTTWTEICPAFSAADAGRRKTARGRRWTGGSCRNSDSSSRVIELRIDDGTTQTTFKTVTLPAGETWVWINEHDGVDLARGEMIDVRSTTTPTSLIVISNFVDG